MADETIQGRKRQMDELAVLYLLGLLDPGASRSFEAMLQSSGGEAMLAFRPFADAAAESAGAYDRELPRAALKSRLMERIRTTDQECRQKARPMLGAIRMNEGVWRESGIQGVSYKVLFYDRARGLITTLVKMEPGASFPAHHRLKPEQCLVVEGDLWHEDHEYGPGDFTWADADSVDPQLRSKNGNVLLIIGSHETKFVS
ncbi:MAG: cupin domain-containing protein [Acidobacteriota bacterium]